nr:hypothetical protein [Sicyoidochytrium minutum DNA virus]
MGGIIHFENFKNIKSFTFEDTGLQCDNVKTLYQTVALDNDGNKLGPLFQGPPMTFRVFRRPHPLRRIVFKLTFEPGECVEHDHVFTSKFGDTKWSGTSASGKIMYDFLRRIEESITYFFLGNEEDTGLPKLADRFPQWIFSGSKGESKEGTGDGFAIMFKSEKGLAVNVFDLSGRPIHGMTPEEMDGYTVIPLFELPRCAITKSSRTVTPDGAIVRQFVLVKKEDGTICDVNRLCKIDTSRALDSV